MAPPLFVSGRALRAAPTPDQGCGSLDVSRQEASVASGDLHCDLCGRIGAVIARAVDATGIADPVALGEHADDLCPARIAALRAVGRDVPFVGTQRPARRL